MVSVVLEAKNRDRGYNQDMRLMNLWRKKCTAFVLGGGGSRGALQVGALRALFEAGIRPDLLVGTSIGAVNATGLALWGVDLKGVDALEEAWAKVSEAQLLDPRISTLILRSMFGLPSDHSRIKIENFFLSMGIDRDLRFRQISSVRLALIGADIESGQPVIFGQEPDDPVLEGLISSIALPPWFEPIQKDGHSIVDGGALSNLPVEPALCLGATRIIALDLDAADNQVNEKPSFTDYLRKYYYAVSRRYACLEMALAEARGVRVDHLQFH